MRTITILSLSAALTLLLTASCEKKSEPPPQPPVEQAEPAEPAPAEQAEPEEEKEPTWAEMDRKQRKRFMGLTVLPQMKKLFQEYKADDYKGFKCQTCHGDDWTDEGVDFKMPNALYPLPADNPIEAAREYDAEITAFMVEKVMPTMGELLGEEVDTETGKGEFGCHSCHLKEG